jgi:DNA-directed RNA polymerase specialized sigma24 family protein
MADDLPPDWPKIVERHAERVFRIAYRILGSVHDAEDVS